MIRFSDGFLSTIRDRIPLSDVVGRKVSWDRRKSRPSKGDHWACCPFHGEKTPSFHVDDRKGRYHCFGCSASGDHFRFLMELDGLSFPEAVELLAGEAGLAMPAPDPQAAQAHEAKLKLHDVLELACVYFQRHLRGSEGAGALAYATGRGLDEGLQNTFRIGFAPDRRDGLIAFLKSHQVPVGDMIETGLVIAPDDGGRAPYDRFRGRLMVAIEDVRGKVVGFGGRVLGQGEPKYLNSPETELFRKREMLFNAQRARHAAHARGRLIVVEGYMDAIALHRAGFEEVVASLGTAMGEEQLALMWRFADEPIIFFDGDKAGQAAAERAMDRALPLIKPGKSLRFLALGEGLDPDDFVKQKGAKALEEALVNALPLIDAVWQREAREADLSTPERMAAFQARLARLSAGIQDAGIRGLYEQALKDRFYAMRRALRAASNPQGSRPARRGRHDAPQLSGASARTAPIVVPPEEQLLALAHHFPDRARRFAERDVFHLCRDERLARKLEAALLGEQVNGESEDPSRHLQPLAALPFPILAQQPSPRFVDMVFGFLFAQLELRAVEDEARNGQSTVREGGQIDDAAMERYLAIQDEARAMRTSLADLERQLDEEATLMRQSVPLRSA